MKKLLIIFITLLLVILPCSANAVQDTTNYLQGHSWQKGLNCEIRQASGLYVEATNITKPYSTPYLDINPALKQIFYKNSLLTSVTVRITGKTKAVFADPSKTSTMRLLIRTQTSLPYPDDWNKIYKQLLDGDEPFFEILGNHVLKGLKTNIPLTSQWTEFEAEFTATKANVFCPVTANWYLCVDNINVDNPIGLLSFSDMSMVVVSTKTSLPTQVATPTPSIPPRITPSIMTPSISLPNQTAKPAQTPKPTASPKPLEETKVQFYEQPLFNDINDIISWAWKGAVVIIIIAGFFAIVLNLFTRRKK